MLEAKTKEALDSRKVLVGVGVVGVELIPILPTKWYNVSALIPLYYYTAGTDNTFKF